MSREELLKAARPILFNTEMVRAILEGKKTETRRPLKPQPIYSLNDGFSWKGVAYGTDLPPTIKGASYNFRCAAPYQPGDILYVRETWGWEPCWDCGLDAVKNGCSYEHERFYSQKNREYGCYCYKASMDDGDTPSVGTWHPSIHMPKKAARIFLKVTDIRPERLQDIDDNGVVAEGLQIGDPFDELWSSTIKKSDRDHYGWDANPWVWVIKFKKLESEDKP